MGTVVSIDVRLPLEPAVTAGHSASVRLGGPSAGSAANAAAGSAAIAAADSAIAAAVAVLHRADDDFSAFRPASWVSRVRRHEIGPDDCPAHVREVYRLAAACRDRTGGYFDAGWRGDGTLDPTGLVKGWAAAAASAALSAAGATTHCVNAAGDLRVRGTPAAGQPWRVGISDPFRRGRLVAVIEGTDLAVATSGPAEQGDHVVNPRTGAFASGLASVTVVGSDLALADAYATAGLAAGRQAPDLLADLARDGWEWLTVETSGRLECSPGLRGRASGGGVLAAGVFDHRRA
jgi:thiamine biosynthesis lipoprotein